MYVYYSKELKLLQQKASLQVQCIKDQVLQATVVNGSVVGQMTTYLTKLSCNVYYCQIFNCCGVDCVYFMDNDKVVIETYMP